ncbi:unnamed protein product [Mytilus edulis]|uniref:Integrase core domain-containing protein n=1 Tax=Mytilus edulis TaxID=6550 RepID=A0A8S3UX96_MYTED|nr:unnamed protein product [Mytilus edulis]
MGSRNFNPVPYQADHFGHKIHLDQNEKLVMFGVTHVIAVDGYSKSAVLKYGMWDQMRVDHGKEFFLCLYMQEKNEQYRNRREYQPYCQTTSIKNHRVERLWVEINNRLNFPIKRAIVQSVNENRIDLDDDIVKYCVSSLLLNLCRIGLKTVVESWNAHPIPGKGKPNELALLKAHTGDIPPELLPSGGDAADSYMNDIGSNLKLPRDFAPNPFQTEDDMLECENTLTMRYPNLQLLISACLNNNDKPLQDAVEYIIQITKNILSR